MAYDGSIRINTKINGKGFNDGLKQMNAGLGRLATTLGITFGIAGIVAFGKASVETAMKMEAGWQGLRYMVQAHGRDINQVKKFLQEYTEDGLVPMMDAQAAYKNLLSRGYETDQLEKMLLVMKDSAVYLRKGQLAIGESIVNTTMGLRTERSILSDSSGIEQNMYKMWQSYATEIGATISSLTVAQKRIAEFNGFMREGAIYAGAAAQYMGTYAGKVAQLTARMVDLRVSVGNAITPILNAILPSITALVLWFTRLFNIIGRVINLLFGTSVGATDMENAAKATEELAGAQDDLANKTEGAGKAAKGALASFDKINVLAQPTAGAGGAVTAPDVSGALPTPDEAGGLNAELDELEAKIGRIVALIKESFASGDFSAIAGIISGWLVGALTKARESIQSFDFRKFGSDIAKAIVSIIKGTDWLGIFKNAAGLLSDGIKGMLDLAIGFIGGLDWSQIISAFGKAFMGAITGIDWAGIVSKAFELLGLVLGSLMDMQDELGRQLADFIKGGWDSVQDYFKTEIAKAGGDVVVGLLVGITNALINIATWIYDNIVKPFVEGFKKGFGIASPSTLMAEQGQPIIDGLKKGIEDAWASVKQWITNTIVDPLKGWFRQAWADIQSVAEGAWEGVKLKWNEAVNWFQTTIIDPISLAFETAWRAIKGFMESPFEGLGEFVKGVFNNVIDFINGLLAGIVSGINGIIDRINSLSFTPPQWAQDLLGVSTVGFNLGYVSTPQIPRLATGAVIPANAPFAAVLGDHKSQSEILAPEDTIRRIVREESGRGGAENGTIHNIIKLDGQVLYDAFKKIDKRVGTSMAKAIGAA